MGWWILLGIVGFFVLLFASPLRVSLSYDKEKGFHYRVRYLFLTLADSQKPPQPKKPKPEKKPRHEKKEKEKTMEKKSSKASEILLSFLGLKEICSAANAKKAMEEKGIVGLAADVSAAVGRLLSRTFRLFGKLVFRHFDLRITVGDSDAADAALEYGNLCAVLYPLFTLLDKAFRFRKRNVDIRCDYELEEAQASFSGELHYRPWHVICYLFWLIKNYFKSTMKKGGS